MSDVGDLVTLCEELRKEILFLHKRRAEYLEEVRDLKVALREAEQYKEMWLSEYEVSAVPPPFYARGFPQLIQDEGYFSDRAIRLKARRAGKSFMRDAWVNGLFSSAEPEVAEVEDGVKRVDPPDDRLAWKVGDRVRAVKDSSAGDVLFFRKGDLGTLRDCDPDGDWWVRFDDGPNKKDDGIWCAGPGYVELLTAK